MRVAYFDCFSGASGDMVVGACLGAGVELDALRTALAGLPIEGYRIDAQPVRKQGFAAVQFSVEIEPTAKQPHRHLHHIREILEQGDLSEAVRRNALNIFTRLAEAEAAVHGTTIEKVHFHEVGAVDAIVDVVGACICLEALGVERVEAGPVPTGSGTVTCDHGVMPIPAPATAMLLRGVPLAESDEPGELTTPTGAAILTTLAQRFGPLPAMTLDRIGVGAGYRDGQHRPNVLRLLLGDMAVHAEEAETDEVLVLEANLDDLSAEVVGYVYDRLFEAGVLDVFASPIYMKKNRPGTLLTVLAPPDRREAVEAVLFAETTTFGIRGYLARRTRLARSIESVETPFGPVRIKIGRRAGRVVTASPEFEDCRAAAARADRPIREVIETTRRLWQERHQGAGG